MGTTDNAAANSAVQNLKTKPIIPAQTGAQSFNSPLSGSVGFGGDNKPDDVLKVSEVLVANGRLDTPTSDVSDALNSKIITAQQDMADGLKPDGLVKPGGPTETRFTNLVQGGMMKAPAAPTILRTATGSRAGNAAITAAGKVGDVDAVRAQALKNTSDPDRTSFHQARDVKRLNTAKDDAAVATARAERLDIKRQEKAQHDQIMTAQKANQQAVQQTEQQNKHVKETTTKAIKSVVNLLGDAMETSSIGHSRAGGSPTDGAQQIDLRRERQIDSRLRGNDERGVSCENDLSDAVSTISDEVFSANRRSAQYLASRSDMQDFPRWEIEDINTQGAPAIAKTADLIQQTNDLDPDQAKRLYDRTITGINPDEQDKLDEMLGQTTHGGTWGIQPLIPPYNTVNLKGDVSNPNHRSQEKGNNEILSADTFVGGQGGETLAGGSGAEWAFRKAGKEINQTIDNTRRDIKEGTLRAGAEVGDRIGLERSSQYLKHFLNGSGKDIVVLRDEARKDPFIRDGEIENRKRFEEDTFVGKSGNEDVNKVLTNLQDGQSIDFSDKWDQDLSFSRKEGIDYLEKLGRTMEPDLLLSLGSLQFTSSVDAKAQRSGNTIYIKGVVTHNGDDRYDFSDGDDAYGAYELQQSKKAKPFWVQQEWR